MASKAEEADRKLKERLERMERTIAILTSRLELLDHAHKNPVCHEVFVGPIPTTGKQRLEAL